MKNLDHKPQLIMYLFTMLPVYSIGEVQIKIKATITCVTYKIS